MLSIVMLIVTLNFVMVSIIILSVIIYAECHYAECHYAECQYAECGGATASMFSHFYKTTIDSIVPSSLLSLCINYSRKIYIYSMPYGQCYKTFCSHKLRLFIIN
jgi:hypothetical protein